MSFCLLEPYASLPYDERVAIWLDIVIEEPMEAIDIGREAGELLAALHSRQEIEEATVLDDAIARAVLKEHFKIQYPTADLIRRTFAAALADRPVSAGPVKLNDDRQAVIDAGILKAWKEASGWPDRRLGEVIGLSRPMVQFTIAGKYKEKLYSEELDAIRQTVVDQIIALEAVVFHVDRARRAL